MENFHKRYLVQYVGIQRITYSNFSGMLEMASIGPFYFK
jgi:hypothetical protein